MFNRKLKTLGLASLLAMSVVLTGCSDDDDDPTGPPMGDGAELRVVHASPDAGNVDIYAEGVAAPLLSNVPYTATSAYLDLAPGVYNIQLRPAGASASSAPVFQTGPVTVPEGARITAIAAGLAGSSAAADKLRVLLMAESFSAPGAANAIVRVVHASADAPTVAVDVGNDGTPEIASLARFADTGGAGVALPAGSPLAIGIWAGAPLARVTAFTTPALPSGGEIFVIATGLLGKLPRSADGFGLLAVGPTGTIGLIRQNPTVFVLHASPDAPAVKLNLAGTSTTIVNSLAFGALSAPLQVAPGTVGLDVLPAAGGALVAAYTTPTLLAGERYLAIASGYVANATRAFTVLPLRDEFTSAAGARVRVMHASPDAPTVDVGTVSGMTFTPVAALSGLAFGNASAGSGLELGAGAVTIGVAAAGSTVTVAKFNLSLTAGQRAFAVAGGSLGTAGQSFRLLVVDVTTFPWQTVSVLPS
ncbi:DUF4397 domain-containing protein [bacterium]|nr:DUF4397 domain-containing protein [bacterium]